MLRPDIISMLKGNGLKHYRVVEPRSGRKDSKLTVHLFLTPPRKPVNLETPFSHDFWASRYPSFQPGGRDYVAPSPMADPQSLIRSGIPLLEKQIKHATLMGQKVKTRVKVLSDVDVFPVPISLSVQQRGFWPTYVALEADPGTDGEAYLRKLVENLRSQNVSECTDGSKATNWFRKLPKP